MGYNVNSTLSVQYSYLDALVSNNKNLTVLAVEIVCIPMQIFITHSGISTVQVFKNCALSNLEKWEICCNNIMGYYVFKANQQR